MHVEYVARGYPLDEPIRAYAEEKLRKLDRFVEEPVEVRLALARERQREIAEIHIAHRYGVLQASETADSMQDAINLAVDKVEKQARRARKKAKDRRRRADRQNGNQWPVAVLAGSGEGAGRRRVIKSSVLHIKPMTVDEAALQLETLKNDFIVFRDSESGRVSVLYKRRDRNYGLIAPEF